MKQGFSQNYTYNKASFVKIDIEPSPCQRKKGKEKEKEKLKYPKHI